MPKIDKVVEALVSERGALVGLIMRWTDIVGPNNHKLMFPFGIRGNELEIAVENPMVKSIVSSLKDVFLKKINQMMPQLGISYIKFHVEPKFFKKRK